MQGVVDRGLHEQVYILAGITPMKSVGMARYMKNKVPGMDVPDELVKRMGGVPKEKQAEEGIKICLETIERLKGVEGVRGFHLMAIEWEHRVAEIVERAGLLPRPTCSLSRRPRCKRRRPAIRPSGTPKGRQGLPE